ncbi:phosphatase PAP2 family protein [Terriglobus aquaticus]|uniref:Phosphatase PAP2 family protein n=1 Tax=Terriglobus aquaticus TaxID=940139 RepID=A0ABW9KRX0_9BACT|nr:phosphatase PAP2 family protein [Terriglobus aquaticus]
MFFALAASVASAQGTVQTTPAPSPRNTPQIAPPPTREVTVDTPVLQGLSTVTRLSQTAAGRAALQANYVVTGAIQNGTTHLPSPLTFESQQQQALRDASITWHNLAQLAEGLGSTLSAAYIARAHEDTHGHATSISPTVQQLIAYALMVTGDDSNAGKYLFANGTTNGHKPVSSDLKSIVTAHAGQTDPFGRAYRLPAGTPGADPFGDSRPFQTEKRVLRITGRDYFNRPTTSESYQRGPAMDLTDSPSYPSGHTTYGYTGAILLGVLVPDRYPEMIARGAEYGSNRIIVGAHYAMDVLGGRTTALYDMAHLLANDSAYLNRRLKSGETIPDFRAAVAAARSDLSAILTSNCGDTVEACARIDFGRFNDPEANHTQYTATQTYTLPVVFTRTASTTEDVSRLAPEAGYLLTAAYPSLTLKQADDLLTETEGPGGGFLNDGSGFGVYSRLNLYEATLRARDMEARSHTGQ